MILRIMAGGVTATCVCALAYNILPETLYLLVLAAPICSDGICQFLFGSGTKIPK